MADLALILPSRLAGRHSLLVYGLVVTSGPCSELPRFLLRWNVTVPSVPGLMAVVAVLWCAPAFAGASLSVGEETSCVARGGEVYCWGHDPEGFLSRCDEQKTRPVRVGELKGATRIALRGLLCALKAGGDLVCLVPRLAPRSAVVLRARQPHDMVAIAAGHSDACIIRRGGQVACMSWAEGRSPFGNTEIEDAISIAMNAANAGCVARRRGAVSCWQVDSSHVDIEGVTDATSVAMGEGHVCTLTSKHQVLCWKQGRHLGKDGDVKVVQLFPEKQATEVTEISAGAAHTCALLRSGRVRCWGDNTLGELGDGTTNASEAAVEVVGLDDAVSIAAGGHHTCAERATGEIVCWGSNHYGQLGDGTARWMDAATDVPGVDAAVEVSVGDSETTCARSERGEVWCWGKQPGMSPHPERVVGIEGAIALFAGEPYSCALSSDGRVRCWQGPKAGAANAGVFTLQGIADVEALVGGEFMDGHQNLCVRTRDRRLTCIASEKDNEIEFTSISGPLDRFVEVPFAKTLKNLAFGRFAACGVEGKGTVACWGELNDIPRDAKGAPTRIPRLRDVESVAVGWLHACALKRSGQVACWSGWQGPFSTRLAGDVRAVAGDGNHFCALKASGRIHCWEEDGLACPGARRVQRIGDARQLSAGWKHACAVRRSGKVACWGENADGALGIGRTAFHPAPVGVLGLPAKRRPRRGAPPSEVAPLHPRWTPERIEDDCCVRATKP